MVSELRDYWLAGGLVHEHSEQEHSVEASPSGNSVDLTERTFDQVYSLCYFGGFGGKGGCERDAHLAIGLDGQHLVTGAGQTDRLRALTGSDVQDRRPMR